jgi:hypothetical protein
MAGNVAQVINFMTWLGIGGAEIREELNRQGTLRIRKEKAFACGCIFHLLL